MNEEEPKYHPVGSAISCLVLAAILFSIILFFGFRVTPVDSSKYVAAKSVETAVAVKNLPWDAVCVGLIGIILILGTATINKENK